MNCGFEINKGNFAGVTGGAFEYLKTVFVCAAEGGPVAPKVYVKIAGVWTQIQKVWIKVGGSWVESNPYVKVSGNWIDV